jgi:hypothetical protein
MVPFGIISATTIAGSDEASARKSYQSKKWSHCKGDKGWHIRKGHHHCFNGEKGCVNTKKHNYH